MSNFARDICNAQFNEMFWDTGQKSFKTFTSVLQKIERKPLQQTRDVLSEREQIELKVVKISGDVQRGLCQLDTIRQEYQVVQQHRAAIEANKDFRYTVTEHFTEKEDLPSGTHVTNCLKCNLTCHNNCAIADDEQKKGCAAMDRNGDCRICIGKCHWSHHKNMRYRLICATRTVTKDASDLKKKYEAAQKKSLNHAQLLAAQVAEFEAIQIEVLYNTNEVRKSLERLSQIALRKDPLNHVDYIDQLIDAERQGAKAGFRERIQQLRGVRDQAQHMATIAADGYDPFGGAVGGLAGLLNGTSDQAGKVPAKAMRKFASFKKQMREQTTSMLEGIWQNITSGR